VIIVVGVVVAVVVKQIAASISQKAKQHKTESDQNRFSKDTEDSP
jgi:mannose/fructose/N-acetylgalactosamine-specific phosphotransferase system component IIC